MQVTNTAYSKFAQDQIRQRQIMRREVSFPPAIDPHTGEA